jgi:hypothetical protein
MASRPAALFAFVIALASPAMAARTLFALDPAQSEIAIAADSELRFGFLGGFDAGVAALTAIGTPGATLPSGTTSDGRRTSVSGTIFAEIEAATSIGFASRKTTLVAGSSGSFAPGLPATPAAPASANLAASFAVPLLDVTGGAALRDTIFSIAAPGFAASIALTPAGTGKWTFAGPLTIVLVQASLDHASSIAGGAGHGTLGPANLTSVSGGTLEDLGAGRQRLTLDVDARLGLPASPLAAPLPVTSIDLHLTGRLVAITAPEPEAAARAVVALGALAALRRRRGKRS